MFSLEECHCCYRIQSAPFELLFFTLGFSGLIQTCGSAVSRLHSPSGNVSNCVTHPPLTPTVKVARSRGRQLCCFHKPERRSQSMRGGKKAQDLCSPTPEKTLMHLWILYKKLHEMLLEMFLRIC